MADANHRLHKEIIAAKTLLAQLADIIGDDKEFAADVVEAETSLNEAIDAVVQRLVDDVAAVKGLETMIADFARRKDRIAARIDNMRTALCVALEQSGKKKIEHPAVTLSLRSVPASVQVTEESAIPSAYWKTPEPKLDKQALLKALKDLKPDEKIPGATLSNGGVCVALKWG